MKSCIHFTGIGGIGMCGLAELMLKAGYPVQGSDAAPGPTTQRLQQLGVPVHIGHKASHIQGAKALVYSTAVPPNNPELQAARQQGLPLMSRPALLTQLINHSPSIAITGAHGKTTTTALVATVLWGEKQRPNVLMGGVWGQVGSTTHLEEGADIILPFQETQSQVTQSQMTQPQEAQSQVTAPYFVVEADESDGFIAKATPQIAVVTNSDTEHLNHYGSVQQMQQAFLQLAQNMRPNGKGLIVGGDDEPLYHSFTQAFQQGLILKPQFYGFHERNAWVLKKTDDPLQYEVRHQGQPCCCITLPLPGDHNALNALAAVVVGQVLKISPSQITARLSQFKGVARRMQYKGSFEQVKIYDDYAHHPTEIKALLKTMKSFFNRPLSVLFQAHKHSRTRDCWHEYKQCFQHCDKLFVTDTYACGEAPIQGRRACDLAAHIQHPNCKYVGPLENAAQKLKQYLKDESGLLLTLGAGDVWRVGEELRDAIDTSQLQPESFELVEGGRPG